MSTPVDTVIHLLQESERFSHFMSSFLTVYAIQRKRIECSNSEHNH